MLTLFPQQVFADETDRVGALIRFRDSSANKGGVTSSSLEVLVGMSLSDKEFLNLMTSPNDEGRYFALLAFRLFS